MKNLMRSMIKGMSFTALVIVVGSTLMVGKAQAQFSIGDIFYGGTGCPAGTAAISIGVAETGRMSILFDKFVVQSGAQIGKRLDRKACGVAIPVTVLSGYSIALVGDGNGIGFYQAGARTQVRLDQEFFLAGARGERFTQVFRGPGSGNFEISANLDPRTLVWSPCGASVNLRANLSLMTQGDSLGELGNLNLKVLFKRCH